MAHVEGSRPVGKSWVAVDEFSFTIIQKQYYFPDIYDMIS